MPEAPMHEDCGAESRQHDVGPTGERFRMEPKAETGGEQLAPDVEFGRRVGTPNRSHHSRSLFGTDLVGHTIDNTPVMPAGASEERFAFQLRHASQVLRHPPPVRSIFVVPRRLSYFLEAVPIVEH